MRVCVDAMVGAAGIATYSRGMIGALRPDVALTQTRGLAARAAFRELNLPRVLERADAVVCVSHATRDALLAHVRVDPAKCHVVGQGPSPFPSLPWRPDRDDPYFLYVGETFPRKNLGSLPTDLPLKVVGPGTEFVSDERLAELYAGASALVLPSLAEGFGRTALDAMARGVPVLASDIPALRELCGDAALLVERPLEPSAWTEAVEALPGAAEELSRRGLERAEAFTWPRVGEQMRALLAGL